MAEIRVYTLEEVAEILHVTKRTIQNYIKDGQLKAVKLGHYWRVSEENLKAFIDGGATVTEWNRRRKTKQDAEQESAENRDQVLARCNR